MTPLLPSVAVGTVEGRTVVESIRTLYGDNITYVEAECIGIDPASKTITCRGVGPEVGHVVNALSVIMPQWDDGNSGDLKKSQVQARMSADDSRGSSSRKVYDSARSRPACEIAYDKLAICVGAGEKH